MFTGITTFLKLKEKYVQCTFLRLGSFAFEEQKKTYISKIISGRLDKRVSEDEEEGRITLNSPYTDHPAVANDQSGIILLDTELPARRARKKTACCMCCGLE
jgi:hypothetical protein